MLSLVSLSPLSTTATSTVVLSKSLTAKTLGVFENESSLRVSTVTSSADVKKVQAAIKLWKEAINERLGNSRAIKNDGIDGINLTAFQEDQSTVKNYQDITKYIQTHLTKHKENNKENIKPSEFKKNNMEEDSKQSANYVDGEAVLQVCSDKNRIQSISVAHINKDGLYVNNLLSAPWNIKMNGKIPEEYLSFVTKGAGKTSLLSLYKLAREKQSKILYLTPSKASFGFYKHVGMVFDSTNNRFLLPVNHKIPENLC